MQERLWFNRSPQNEQGCEHTQLRKAQKIMWTNASRSRLMSNSVATLLHTLMLQGVTANTLKWKGDRLQGGVERRKCKVIRAASVGSLRIPSALACTCSPSPAWCDGCNPPCNTSRCRYVRWRRTTTPSEVCAGTRAALSFSLCFFCFPFSFDFSKIPNNRISSVGVLTSCQTGNATECSVITQAP